MRTSRMGTASATSKRLVTPTVPSSVNWCTFMSIEFRVVMKSFS